MEDEWSNKFYEIFIFNSESPDVSGIRCFYMRLIAFIMRLYDFLLDGRIWCCFDFSPACQAHSDKFPHAQHLDIDLWVSFWAPCSHEISASRHSMKISIMNSHSKIQECNLSSHGEARYKSSNRRFAVSASATSVQRLQISTIRTNNPESPWWRLSPLIWNAIISRLTQ